MRMIAMVVLCVTVAAIILTHVIQGKDVKLDEATGWLFMGVVMLLMFIIGLLFRPRE